MAILCTGLLICAMMALPICTEQVFLNRSTISSGGEIVILIGFLLVPVFNLVSLGWVIVGTLQNRVFRKGDMGTMALGVLCLILLLGEKVMADEIGREYSLGWEVVGEWIILYVFLVIQLLYDLVILRRLYHSYKDPSDETGV